MRTYLWIGTAALAAVLALTGCDILNAIDKELDSAADASTRNNKRGSDTDLNQTDATNTEPNAPTLSDELKAGINTLSKQAEQIWKGLPTAEIPDDAYICEPPLGMHYGGMLTFFCHISDDVSFAHIQDTLGIQVFLSGPHNDDRLHLASLRNFGRYNPEFVKTLTLWTLPAAKSETFRKATQHAYVVGPQITARTYWAAYQKLKANPDYWIAQQNALLEAIDSPDDSPHEFYWKFSYFMNPRYSLETNEWQDLSSNDNKYYPHDVIRSAVGFWIRRAIDGTAQDFATALHQLLILYDADFLAQTNFASPTIAPRRKLNQRLPGRITQTTPHRSRGEMTWKTSPTSSTSTSSGKPAITSPSSPANSNNSSTSAPPTS